MELVGKKEFAAAALDSKSETFVVYVMALSFVISFSFSPFHIHPCCKPQIAILIAKKASKKMSDKYIDFTDVFSPDLAFDFRKHSGINNYAIKLVNSQQLSYEPIYSLGLVELETSKTYIETNLANKFIRLS